MSVSQSAETVEQRLQVEKNTPENTASKTKTSEEAETSSRKESRKDTDHRKTERVSKFDFSVILVSTFVGVSNITRFPANSFKHGGVSYIIVYTAVFLLYGLPMVTIDAYIGQFTQSPAVLAYWKFAPISVGLTIAGQLHLAQQALAQIVLVVRAIRVFAAYTADRNAPRCSNQWNDKFCLSLHDDVRFCNRSTEHSQVAYALKQCITTSRTHNLLTAAGNPELASSQLYINEVLNNEGDITNFSHIDPFRFFGLSVFLTFSVFVAMLNLKKCVFVLKMNALWMISFVTLIFVAGIFCPPKYLSIRPSTFLKNTQWNAVYQIETWLDAIYHVTLSMNLGSTSTSTVSKYNPYNRNYVPWALLAAFVDYSIGMSMAVGMSFVTSALGATLFEVTVADLNQNSAVFLFGLLPQTLSYHSHTLAAVAMFFAIPFCLPPAIVFSRIIMHNLGLLATSTTRIFLWKIGGLVTISILVPLLFSFENGDLLFDWLASYDDLMGTSTVFLQILLLHGCYGTTQIKYDLDSMIFYGSSRKNARKLCHLLVWLYDYVIPFANIFVICNTIVVIQHRIESGKGTLWSQVSSMLFLPTIFCSLLIGIAYPLYFMWTRPATELLRVQETHPSYSRLRVVDPDVQYNH